ncbi:MAG: FHA domain-containing protein [Chloroflexota bacterium]
MESDLWLLFLRIGVLALIYLFLTQLGLTLRRTLSTGERTRRVAGVLGRFVVVESSSPSLTRGETYPVQDLTSLGRAPTNSIKIEDPFVSAEHAVVTLRGDDLIIEDLGSTNGTFVNRRQIAGPTPLHSGDVVQVGQAKVKLVR